MNCIRVHHQVIWSKCREKRKKESCFDEVGSIKDLISSKMLIASMLPGFVNTEKDFNATCI